MDRRRSDPCSRRRAQADQLRVEEEIRETSQRGETARAAQDALWLYGAETFGFLVGVLDDRRAAGTLYAGACRRLEKQMPEFPWTCSLRTWMYALARQQLAHHRGSATRRSVGKPLANAPDLTQPVSGHPGALRMTIAALRRRLAPEDREVLILRFDRALGWRDIAITSLGPGASALELGREASRLQARLRAIREELAARARGAQE